MVLVIDNYDSFVYNLVQYLGECGVDSLVRRSDAIAPDEALRLRPAGIIISPGPRGPLEAGNSVPIIRAAAGRVPILGVCLGHQAIGAAFGARIRRARRPMHGKTSPVRHDGSGCLRGLPSPLRACRYHSLVVDGPTLPAALLATAFAADDGEVMAIRHRELLVEGLQFHPESLYTQGGHRIVANFVAACGGGRVGAGRGPAPGRAAGSPAAV